MCISTLGLFVALVGLLALITGQPLAQDDAERLVYKTVDGATLGVVIYKPHDWKATDRRPCIVWFFGGSWKVGSPYQFSPQAKHLAKLGIVSLCADYRVESRHGTTPHESTLDAKSAIRWVRLHAAELGIDPARVAAAGGSSGGQLAASCAVVPDSDEEGDEKGGEAGGGGKPNAMILFNPVLSFEIPKVREATGAADRLKLMEISPLHQLAAAPPPTIIFHGKSDPIVPYESVIEFKEKADTFSEGIVQIVGFEGRTHDFFNYGNSGNRDYRETLRQTEAFLRDLGWVK